MIPNPIFKRYSLQGIGQTLILRQASLLVITLAMLAMFAVTAYAQEPTNGSEVEASGPAVAPAAVSEQEPARDSAFLAANPELLKAHPPMLVEEVSESTFLANNPELMAARRYPGAIEHEGSQPDTYDIELLRIRRYAEAAEKRAEAAYLAANPELLKARPPVWSLAVICARRLAANPELLKAYPPAASQKMREAEFLAANPELLKVRPPVWSPAAICAGRLAAAIEAGEDPTFLAANPELSEKLARQRMMTGVASTFLPSR